ncbi:hypothetical protein [Kibdelosporangium philippinense]
MKVSSSDVSRFETGKRKQPSMLFIAKYAWALDASLDELFSPKSFADEPK